MEKVKARWICTILLSALAGCEPGPPGGLSGAGEGGVGPAPVRVRPFQMGTPDVVMLVTGGTNGMLEVCNCTGTMPGGLARRSGLVISYRAAFEHTFLLDSGDAFWIEGNDVRNDYVFRGYRLLGYDAVVLGDQEWAAYPQRLGSIIAETQLTCLSTTVAPANPGASPALPIKRLVTREWPGVKLAVLSDVHRETFLFFPEEQVAQFKFSPPQELPAQIAKLKREGFVVVVVAHMDQDTTEQAAASLGADLVVRGHTSRPEEALLHAGGKPIVKAGGSETVGVVAMKMDAGRIAAIEYRMEIVNERWPMDKRLIQTYQAYAHVAMRRALDAERKKGLDYVPSSECGQCHKGPYQAWRSSKHARAYQTLADAKRSGDPNCLMCHTSGFGTEKGFYTIQKTPKLAGVNCQDCHRFNVAEHRQKGFTVPQVKEDICTACHTPVTDLKFEYKARLAKVRCPHQP